MLVLVLGIVGLVLCQLTAPIASVMGRSELRAIAEGRRPPENQGLASAGRLLGIIGTVLLTVGVLAILVVVTFGLASTVTMGPR